MPETDKVILVNSPNSGDGKSTMASLLAFAFAMDRKRVVLVDLDLRASRMHTNLGINHDPGMSSVLTGATALQYRPAAVGSAAPTAAVTAFSS